ncbi:MAG: Exodeoxyribonuclease 7 small subunit [Phycisphaerae bacterium]|nr:Exodeoxyribonuclease 7 small subunit [Phycisphaerae bacterium]
MTSQEMNFEQSIARLEELVRKVEQGKIGLEESIQSYEEGMRLLNHCRQILQKAELRVQQLQQADETQFRSQPYPDDSSPTGKASPSE